MLMEFSSPKERTGIMEEQEIKKIVKETVKETLISLGVDACNPMEVQQDLHFLHDCRLGSEKLKSKVGLAIVGVLVTTALAALWLGITAAINC